MRGLHLHSYYLEIVVFAHVILQNSPKMWTIDKAQPFQEK